jgi:hypothetical protein
MARPLGGSRASAASKTPPGCGQWIETAVPVDEDRGLDVAGPDTGEQAIHGWTDPRQIGGEHHNRWRARVHDVTLRAATDRPAVTAASNTRWNVPGGLTTTRRWAAATASSTWARVAAVEIERRLVGAAEPGGGAAGENNGVEGQDHATHLRRPQVVPAGLRYP